jgi:glycosyltransferase involved in cell wall biosynthesis
MKVLTLDNLPSSPPGRSGWPWTAQPPSTVPRARLDASPSIFPRITIVIPSFNQGSYLEETMRSVLLQGYPNLELIVVDGGSTDDSVEIIRRYESHLAWWVSERDKGQSHAINKGFARSTGAIHGYLASDDFLEPGALHAVAGAFGAPASSERSTDWVVGHVRYQQDGAGSWPLRAYDERSFADWFLHCPIPQPGCFWSAQLHRAAGEFREDLHYYFDYEFWLRLRFIHKRRPKILDRELAVYRLHPASKTVANNAAFHVEGRMIRASYEPLLTARERMQLRFARRRHRARRYGGRSLASFAAGERVTALRSLATALVLWPAILFDRSAITALRQHFHARDGRAGIPMPNVWIDPDE